MAAIPTETEIKLVFDAGAGETIEKHSAFAESTHAGRKHREITTYFDTDDLLLHRNGYSLRIRQSDGHFTQTLKQVPQEAAAHQRNEWEWPLKNNRPLLRPVQKLMTDTGLDGDLHHPEPRIVTDIQRRNYEIVRDGCGIDAVIDEGVVRAGGREERIHEIELELKHGPAGPAYRLALELLEHRPFRLGAESKADRGYRLLTGSATPPQKARGAALPRDATLGGGLDFSVRTALQGFLVNLPAAQEGAAEGIHQARVALRRVRSALVLYGPCLEKCARDRFNNAIREMGAALGAVRDWDVFVDQTLCEAARAGVPADWIAALGEQGEARREEARAEIREKLASKEPAEFVLGLEAWVSEPAWATQAPHDPDKAARKVMPGLLDRLACKVARRGRNLARLSPSELHPLRKSIKKLRYSAESMSELYPRKSVKRYAKACKKLQTILGAINDAQVTARLLAEIAPADSAALGAAAGALARWNTDRRSEIRSELENAWRKLKDADPFWE